MESIPSPRHLIEDQHVHQIYDKIAPSFSSSRNEMWPSVKEYLDRIKPQSLVLDAGCGNGKNMLFHPDIHFIGCDTCKPLINICRSNGLLVTEANLKDLPFQDNFFDHVICIAVLHHIWSPKDRAKALKELNRVVKKGGTFLIYVWSTKVLSKDKKGKKFKPYPLPVAKRISNEELSTQSSDKIYNNDFLVTWKNKEERYYHLFDRLEFHELFNCLEGQGSLVMGEDEDNIYGIWTKD